MGDREGTEKGIIKEEEEVEVIICINKICELLESYIITYNIHGQYDDESDDESIIKFKKHIKYLINISKEKYKKYINSYYESNYSHKYGDLEEVEIEESNNAVSFDNILKVLYSNINKNNGNKNKGEEYDNIIEYLPSITTEKIPITYRRMLFLGSGNNKQYKEILGKRRRIYKIKGSRKEHIKYKGELIPVSDYKKLFKKSSKK